MPLVKAHVDVLAFIQLRHQFFENADLKLMIHGSVLLKGFADDAHGELLATPDAFSPDDQLFITLNRFFFD